MCHLKKSKRGGGNPPFLLFVFKSSSAPLNIHQCSKRLTNQIGFWAHVVERDSDFLSHAHQSLTNITRWLMLAPGFGIKHLPLMLLRVWVCLCCVVMWLGSRRNSCSETETLALGAVFQRWFTIPWLCSLLTSSLLHYHHPGSGVFFLWKSNNKDM